MTPRERRIAALEAAKRAKAKRAVPLVMRVPFGQTIAEARAAFDAAYDPKPGHAVLCVPAKPVTEAEHALWAERFHARQMALVADARRERFAVVKSDGPAPQPPVSRWPTSPVIRPNGAHVNWRPNA